MTETKTQPPSDNLQELVAQYDREQAFRPLSGWIARAATLLAIGFSVYQVATAIFPPPPAQIHRALHLAFALGLIFLVFSPSRRRPNADITVADGILALLGLGIGAYWLVFFDDLVQRAGSLTALDYAVGLLTLLLVLEGARRVVGWPMVIIVALFVLYALFGKEMPGLLSHRGVNLERLISHLAYTTEGIFGVPLAASAKFIFLFILFGVFLERTGVGTYFNDLALVLAGKRVGGPAKVAVFSSALQGTISGSSVANVVTSGAFTIPMMKRLGYRPSFAGATEAASSTGGQIMPPVMGAAAFLMAEAINVPYAEIALAATIPALLYFTGIWIMVHFEARKTGLRGLRDDELPDRREVLKKLYLLLPIGVIIYFLMSGTSTERAALYGIASTIAVGALRKETRLSLADIVGALAEGAKAALSVVAATAAAGIIVGVVTLTGLGLKFASGLVELSGGIPILTLFFTMVASLVLGMGVPTTANYIITSTMTAPAIVQLGYPVLAAHMFAFYFGILADITPPVALAAFAASAISGASFLRTGIDSVRLAIAAFLVPYVFVFSPQMLLINTTLSEALWVAVTAFVGMIGVGAGVIGFWLRPLNALERLLAIGAGLALIVPGFVTDAVGLGLLGGLWAWQLAQTRNKPPAQTA